MSTDFSENISAHNGGSFNFVKGNALANYCIEVGKAYGALGYVTRIIPQNPSRGGSQNSDSVLSWKARH